MSPSIAQSSTLENFAISSTNQPVRVDIQIQNQQNAKSEVKFNGVHVLNPQGNTFNGNFFFLVAPTQNSIIEINTLFHDINPNTNEVYFTYTIQNGAKKQQGKSAKLVIPSGSLQFVTLFIKLV